MWPRLDLNSRSSRSHIPSAGMTGVYYQRGVRKVLMFLFPNGVSRTQRCLKALPRIHRKYGHKGQMCSAMLLPWIALIITLYVVHFPAQWHQQIPTPISIRPSGSRYGSLTSKGLDIFSAFSSVESAMVYSCTSRSVVESDEL